MTGRKRNTAKTARPKRYHKRFLKTSDKTTTPEGKREYQRQYMYLKRAGLLDLGHALDLRTSLRQRKK